MEKLILPDKVLDRQFCTQCLNYLSVGPVMISREGNVICGRCSKSMDLSVDSGFQPSFYNLFAEHLLFKCINYHAGCSELLRFNEALAHEEQCKRNGLTCPYCNYEGNLCQLIRHFEITHKYSVSEDSFKVLINEDKFLKNAITIKNGCIFCVAICGGSDQMGIYDLLLTSENTEPFNDFKLTFFDPESNLESPPIRINSSRYRFQSNIGLIATISKRLITCNISRTMLTNCFPSGSCSCKIELMDKNVVPEDGYFIKMIEEIDRHISQTRVKKSKRDVDSYIDYISNMPKFDLKLITSKLYASQRCVNCMAYVTSPVYFCPKYHMSCGKCTASKCSICNACCQWNCKTRLHNVSLQCDWGNQCNIYTNIFEFMRHKQDCKSRRYQCPDRNCNYIGRLSGLKKHWHLNPLKEDNEITIGSNIGGRYWLNPKVKDLFYVTFDQTGCVRSLVSINILNTFMYKSYKFIISQDGKYGRRNLEFNLFCGNKSGNLVQYLCTDQINCCCVTLE